MRGSGRPTSKHHQHSPGLIQFLLDRQAKQLMTEKKHASSQNQSQKGQCKLTTKCLDKRKTYLRNKNWEKKLFSRTKCSYKATVGIQCGEAWVTPYILLGWQAFITFSQRRQKRKEGISPQETPSLTHGVKNKRAAGFFLINNTRKEVSDRLQAGKVLWSGLVVG